MSTQQLDQSKVDAFDQKMLGILNSQALGQLISIGHQLKLFEVMAELPSSTSAQIAEKAGLNERYVREWLAGMVVGCIAEYDSSSATYILPPEHAARLTRSAHSYNLASLTQSMLALSNVEPIVVDSFRKGGGVPYSAYTHFADFDWPNEEPAIVASVLPLVPEILDRLRHGIDVADVACGDGVKIIEMAQAFPQSRFVGYDISEDGISAATTNAQSKGLTNLRFEVKDISRLDMVNQFDFITGFDAIHDLARPAAALQGISKALQPGGTFLMVDITSSSKIEENIDHPLGTWLYGWSVMYCMTVSLALDGEGLGTMWGWQKAKQMLEDVGLNLVEIKRLEHDRLTATIFVRSVS